MPITLDYSPVGALGALGLAAGQAEAQRTQNEQALRQAALQQQAQAQAQDAALRQQQLQVSAYQQDMDRWARANAQQQLLQRDYATQMQEQQWRTNQQQAAYANQTAMQQAGFDNQRKLHEADAQARAAYAENAFWMNAVEAPDKAINSIRNTMAGMQLEPEDQVDFRGRLGALTKIQESARSIRPQQYAAALNEWLNDFRGSGLLQRAKAPPTTQDEFLRNSFKDEGGTTWFKKANGDWDYREPPAPANLAANATPQAFQETGKNRMEAAKEAYKILLDVANKNAGDGLSKVTLPKREEVEEVIKGLLGLGDESQPIPDAAARQPGWSVRGGNPVMEQPVEQPEVPAEPEFDQEQNTLQYAHASLVAKHGPNGPPANHPDIVEWAAIQGQGAQQPAAPRTANSASIPPGAPPPAPAQQQMPGSAPAPMQPASTAEPNQPATPANQQAPVPKLVLPVEGEFIAIDEGPGGVTKRPATDAEIEAVVKFYGRDTPVEKVRLQAKLYASGTPTMSKGGTQEQHQAEWELIPNGAVYIDPNGRRAVKQ